MKLDVYLLFLILVFLFNVFTLFSRTGSVLCWCLCIVLFCAVLLSVSLWWLMCVSCFSLFFLVVLVCGGVFLCEVFVVCVFIAVSCPSSCLLFYCGHSVGLCFMWLCGLVCLSA